MTTGKGRPDSDARAAPEDETSGAHSSQRYRYSGYGHREWIEAMDGRITARALGCRADHAAVLYVVARRLADHGNVKGEHCRPGASKLAQALGLSERTVRRALDELDREGWITKVRGGNRKLGHADEWALCVPDYAVPPHQVPEGYRSRYVLPGERPPPSDGPPW